MSDRSWCPGCKADRVLETAYAGAGRHTVYCPACKTEGPACITSQEAREVWEKLFPRSESLPTRRYRVPVYVWPDGCMLINASGYNDLTLQEIDAVCPDDLVSGWTKLVISFEIPNPQDIPATVEPPEPKP